MSIEKFSLLEIENIFNLEVSFDITFSDCVSQLYCLYSIAKVTTYFIVSRSAFINLHFFLFIKNAMRAVTENFPTSVEMPPIQVMITKGKEDMTIKVRVGIGQL